MAVVDITIKNRIASAPAGVELVCNNPTDTIHFNFDEEWNGVNEKTARFSWEGKYAEVSFVGDSVKVPEIYKTDYVFVGVYGVQIASTPVKVQCKRSILCYGDTVRAPLTDPFYEEFCERINAAEEKVSEMQEVIDSTYTYLEDGGSPLNIPGNAGTATKLHTPVKIGDVDFDGSTDVTLSDMGAVGYSEQDFSDEAMAQARANIDAAKASHAHGGITNDGKLGTVSGRIITTGTGGKMEASTAESARTILGMGTTLDDVAANTQRITALETYEQRPFEYVGNPVVLENYENMPMNCVVSMLPIQSGSGDPSPDNIRPISGRTVVTVTRCGADDNIKTYTISLGQTVYGGVLDVRYGVLTITRVMMTLNGSEAWQAQDTGKGYRMKIDISDIVKAADNSVKADIICSDYKTITANQSWDGIETYGVSQGQNWTDVFFNDEVYAASGDVAAWKAYLAGHPVQICYKLAAPVVVRLSGQEITALEGTNTLYTDGDNLTVRGRTDILWLTSNMIEQLSADSVVTESGAKAVSGAAVAAYVAQQIAAITDFEGDEF